MTSTKYIFCAFPKKKIFFFQNCLLKFGGKWWLNQSIKELVNDKAVYRTALATPSLLKKKKIVTKLESMRSVAKIQWIFWWNKSFSFGYTRIFFYRTLVKLPILIINTYILYRHKSGSVPNLRTCGVSMTSKNAVCSLKCKV